MMIAFDSGFQIPEKAHEEIFLSAGLPLMVGTLPRSSMSIWAMSSSTT